MTRKHTETGESRASEGLASLLQASARGGRLLYVGGGAGVRRLAQHADRIVHLHLGEENLEKLPNVQRRKLAPGRIDLRPGSFDLVIVPDLMEIPDDPEELLLDLAEIAAGGVLAVGIPFTDRRTYEDFVDLVDDVLDVPRLYGIDAFEGLRVAELGDADDAPVVSALGAARTPFHILAVAGPCDDLPASILAESARSGREAAPNAELLAELDEALSAVREAGAKIAALEDELATERARAAEIETAAAERERSSAKLREKLERERERLSTLEELAAEQRVVESRLEARGEELRALRGEVDRRGVLVRDLVEELRTLRRRGAAGGSSPALERALDAEARREASALEADELRARVLELEDQLEAARAASARASREASREPAPSVSSEDVSSEVREALGERDGLALRVAHLEAALEAERARRGPSTEAAPGPAPEPSSGPASRSDDRVAELQAEIMEARAVAEATKGALDAQAELVRRLQRDLAATEVALRAAEERNDHDIGEISRLRDATVEAAEQADRAAADAADARAELERLRADRAALIASEAAALGSAEAARRALVEAKAALVELESRASTTREN